MYNDSSAVKYEDMGFTYIREFPRQTVLEFVEPTIKLKKDGTPKKICQNKVAGRKSEVYPFEIEDMKKMISYFEDNKMWVHYLLFVMSCNMARRVGDMLSLRWINLYNPDNGKLRSDILEIREDKTDKLANPHINSAVRDAIEKYIERTNCRPSNDNYQSFVFTQLSGNYKGRVLSDSAYLKALKKAGVAIGIEYNIGTHSARKTFGKISRMLHPSDYDSMELLQTIYNHSDTKTTKSYIGLTREKINQYYDDMGEFFGNYVVGDMEYIDVSDTPIVSLDTNDLRDIVKTAYEAGLNNHDANVSCHIDAINNIMSMIEQLRK